MEDQALTSWQPFAYDFCIIGMASGNVQRHILILLGTKKACFCFDGVSASYVWITTVLR